MTKLNQNLCFEDVQNVIKTYIIQDEELKLIEKAYLYALEKHRGEKRLTGDDYINHPLNVAHILASMNADYETICAGFLHDILENPDNSREELIEHFGEEILDENGKIDPTKLKPITYDPIHHKYLVLGEQVGNAFADGKKLV